jgi:transcription elongation factor/antiterminator RfaH
MLSATGDTLCWYVVHTHPNQEERTNSNLRALGLETVSPKLRVNRYNEFTGHLTRITKPLFPSYIFARFKFNELYHRIRFTRGVHSLVCFNNSPTPVEDDIVGLVQSRIGSDGFVKTFEELKAGDEVLINDGRFQNLCGVFEREMPDADRVRILLSTVNFQAHVVVNRGLVSKVSQEEHSQVA